MLTDERLEQIRARAARFDSIEPVSEDDAVETPDDRAALLQAYDALRARVAELEAGHVADERSIARLVDERNRAEQLVSDQRDVLLTQKRDRAVALATLERVREALAHSGDEPAIDTLARIEAALR